MILLSRFLLFFLICRFRAITSSGVFVLLWVGMLVYVGGFSGAYSMDFSCRLACSLSMIF